MYYIDKNCPPFELRPLALFKVVNESLKIGNPKPSFNFQDTTKWISCNQIGAVDNTVVLNPTIGWCEITYKDMLDDWLGSNYYYLVDDAFYGTCLWHSDQQTLSHSATLKFEL